MSRIEISLQEYNELKTKIRILEKSLHDVSLEAAASKEKIGKAEALAMDLENEGLYSRVFQWKSTISPLLECFKKK